MQILKVIARLMDYPKAEVAESKSEIAEAIAQSRHISPAHRARLKQTLQAIYDGELMEAEEAYTGLFDQGRSLSLHLFEHVHGESRDRGQAMVDLMAEYSGNGFEIDSPELPDYLPLFLEYLSYRPDLEAREWLADVSHILAVLGARLVERESPYAHLFESLLLIAGRSEELEQKREQVASEEPDNTPEALDKEWEEVAVTFGTEDQSCATPPPANPNEAQPLRWAEPASNKASITGEQRP
ncbi:MAG: nitrate reductase molybdenum cofactor assembly chaperone [Gammaproteobacteria bacterium]|nr:nitrate reductase molybdenum cofactor assembly chaperone [Gammaproteobacteria bacterium]MBT8150377.1 nitrate reductase molybdenum cofactor assembly chaperone [Gammaproteobacteria bacterium]NND40175.1 nitrate reductase molybdenum cofactor assembly chaperone [Pseudomonadales bacterium]NNM11425.1 nitrate reductase molybdenum cofactor assembly chaperone [Pseudomonadales bacterium]RZV54211.1 MAG: nitrate reductase molybdenum cofactor assembly chaperone [Pseudomonadales bacterium]